MDPLQTAIVAFVVMLYGTFVSWAEERFGKFQDLDPRWKQVVNSLLTIVVPAVVQFLAPYWKPEFGAPDAAVTQLLYILIPIGVWLASQVAHHFDPSLWLRPGEEYEDDDTVRTAVEDGIEKLSRMVGR